MQKVLLTEDDDHIREGLVLAFERAGIPLTVTGRLSQAEAS